MRWLLVYLFFAFTSVKIIAQNNYFSGGDSASVFLCQDGTVFTVGANGLGQLGRGALPPINSPDIVSGIGGFGSLYSIKQVSGKQYNTLIALSLGGDSVITWGSNGNGQLGNNLYGNNITNNNRFPYRVIGVGASGYLTGIKSVAMGLRTGYAITNQGKVVSWGSGNNGALGNGTNGPDMTSPVYVLKAPGDTLINVTAIAAGDDCALALLSDGTVWGWGRNNHGQLGQNTNLDSYYAVQVKGKTGVGFLNDIISITASGTHVLALSSKDTLWAWGNNSDGQLGNNSTVDSYIPVAVLNSTGTAPLRSVTAIAADWRFSMALRRDSTISIWGNNSFGQFGNNTVVSSLIPMKVLDEAGLAPIKGITSISTYNMGAYARRANGDFLVWGDNRFGQLGFGNYIDTKLPMVLSFPCILASPPAFSKGTISGPLVACGSTNSGTVSVAGQTGNVVAWHSSTNNFASYSVTASSSSSFNFSNISQKTSYRAVIQFNDQIGYSDSLVVQFFQPSSGGTLGSSAIVCASANTGTINLSGHTGSILGWESSVDSFATAGVPILNTTASQVYNNLASTQYYRVVVKSGLCPSAYSPVVKITVDDLSVGGLLSSTFTAVCASANGASINLSGQTGSILRWESSGDGFSSFTPISNITTSYNYLNLSTGTQFRVQVKNGVCPSVYSSVFAITVDQSTIAGTLGTAATVCSGANSGTLSLGVSTGSILQWESSSDGFSSIISPITNTTNSQLYTNITSTTSYRVLLQNGVCPSAYSNIVAITVDNPTIGGIVSASNTVCFGTNSGSMSLTGQTGNVVRWEYSSDNFGSFINPIFNSTLVQAYSGLTVTTYYRAVVQNGVCPPLYSSTNIITVDPLSSPGSLGSSAVVCSGTNSGTLTLSSYVGTILGWENSTDNFSSVINSISNTSTSENYNNLISTTYYRVKIQNGVCPTVYSPVVTITVTPLSVGGSVGASTTVCSGSNGATLLLSGHTGSILNWEYSTDGFVSDINAIANTNNTQAYLNLTTTTQYRALVKNGSCSSVYSTPAIISVDAPSAAGSLSTSATVCSGTNFGTLTLSGTIVGSIVLWQSSTDNFVTIINPIANTTNSHNYTNITATTSYRVEIKNGVCAPVFSNAVLITVNAVSAGGILSTSTSVCSGTNFGTLSLSGSSGSIVQWESSTDGFSTVNVISNTGLTNGYSNIVSTTYYRTMVKSGVCPAVYSTTATITVYPVSAGGVISFPDTVCFGFNSGTLTLSSQTGNILRWEKSTDNFGTYTVIANITPVENYNNLVNTTYYRALVQNGACVSAYSSIVEITVNPNSVGGIITGSDTVCTSTNSGTLFLSGYLGVVVQWETSTDNFVTVTVPVSNTTDTIAYSGLTATTYYRAQIQNTGCAIAYPSPAIIKVDPVSVGGTLTAPAVVCANSNSGVIKLVGSTGKINRWETSLDNFVSNTLVSNVTDSIEYLNLPKTTFYRVLVQNGVCPAVYSNVTAVTVNPASVGGVIIGAKNVCIQGNYGSLVLTNDTGAVVHWETSTNNFINSTIIANTTHVYSYTNITSPFSLRVLVQYSPCPAVYSNVFSFIVNPATVSGVITGNAKVKKGEGSGPLTLINSTGGVIEWEYSSDTSLGWVSVPITSNVYSFTDMDTSLFVRVKVKSGNCDELYSPAFYIEVVNEVNTDIKIYPTISPNADNINDEWIIDNITFYPSNKVRIFNRWGDMVYEERGYDNAGKIWRGQSNTHFTISGHDLPEGTYFYVLDPGNGKPEFSGYVVLNR